MRAYLPQSKPVWAASVSRRWLEMCVHLYRTTGDRDLLQTIKYTPLGGPAFIWSLNWSADGARFIVGCWNQQTFLYHVDPDAGDAEAECEEPLVQICCVKRSDRVYSVGLDAHGHNLVVGGRDKKCAMYDCEHPGIASHEPREAHLIWEVASEDFVYAVALSEDMQTCAFGGTAKTVHVLSASSGTALFTVPCTGIIWALAILEDNKGNDKLVIGGELPVLTVVDVVEQSDYLHIPVQETTYDIAITHDSICFTTGWCATMFGKGGMACSWDEQPSFIVLSSWVQAMLSSEEQLLHMISLILDRHPAVVNTSHPEKGGSLVQYVIQNTNQPKLLEKLLTANCRIGLPRDWRGRSPLHVAIEHGKWRALQLLIDALLQNRFSIIPGAMALVSECLQAMAYKYPLDFLHFIASFELQPEPEILGDVDASDVMLPRRLLCGSSRRCPKGVWNNELDEYRVVVAGAGMESSDGFNLGRGLRGSGMSEDSSATPTAKVVKRRMSISDLNDDLNERSSSRSPSERSSSRSSKASDAVATAMNPAKNTPGKPQADSGGAPEASAKEMKVIELGFSANTNQTGVQAYRVPFENFAALSGGESGQVSPLQLVVEAVSATHVDYSVFGSKLIEIILEYKWHRFAKKKFWWDFLIFFVNVAIVTVWNSMATKFVLGHMEELWWKEYMARMAVRSSTSSTALDWRSYPTSKGICIRRGLYRSTSSLPPSGCSTRSSASPISLLSPATYGTRAYRILARLSPHPISTI